MAYAFFHAKKIKIAGCEVGSQPILAGIFALMDYFRKPIFRHELGRPGAAVANLPTSIERERIMQRRVPAVDWPRPTDEKSLIFHDQKAAVAGIAMAIATPLASLVALFAQQAIRAKGDQ